MGLVLPLVVPPRTPIPHNAPRTSAFAHVVRILAGLFLRVILAALISATLVAISIAAIHVTTAPELVSLLVEPFSLLLLPGLVIEIAQSRTHDYSPNGVVLTSFLFYFALAYILLSLYARSRRRRSLIEITNSRAPIDPENKSH